ncbi:MAG: glycosyltransferase [Acidobacteriia bacterium]|nr:glycosyltransferase [Terriglobia bacterium]
MRVCFVADYNCIRVAKEARVLLDHGHQVHLLAGKYRDDSQYTTTSVYANLNQFRNAVQLYKDKVDVWQVHNEPNFHAIMIRELLPDAKIVLDMHDSNYWRVRNEKADSGEEIRWVSEDAALACSDGAVITSGACQIELKKRFAKPVAIIPSAVPYAFFKHRDYSFLGGLVCNGAHVRESEIMRDGWRDYTKIYKRLKELGIPVSIYAPNLKDHRDTREYYQNLVDVIKSAVYLDLLGEIGMYSWSLVGNWTEKHQPVWDFALPNKLFDGIAAGVPPVVIGNKPSEDLVLRSDIGIVVQSPDELKERWGEHVEKRKNLLLKRSEFCMENYIGGLENLYESI